MPSNSPEIAVQSDFLAEGTRNTPRAARECSSEVLPQTEELCDLTDTYPYMEHHAETSSEQPNKNLTNPPVQNEIYVITRNLIATTITDTISCATLVYSTKSIRRRSSNLKNALRNQHVALKKLVVFCSGYSLATNSLPTQS